MGTNSDEHSNVIDDRRQNNKYYDCSTAKKLSKSFEAKRTSVATTNSVALTPANTALFIAPVETTTKQIEINYNKIKDTEKP